MALVAIAVIVPNTNSFLILLATRALAFSILVMSLDILLGFTGLASLGQAAYLGVGAYLTAILATKYHFGLGYDFWLVVLLGILLGAALAAVFGLLAIRASGVYFLMITLALGQCVWGLAYRWNSLTGGDNGINLRDRPKFGIDLSNEVTFFYVVFGFFAVSLLLMYMLVRSPFGRSLLGIRERELRMQILGYNTWLHKYLAFVIAGGVRRPVGRPVGAHGRHRQSRERRPHHVGRCASDGRAGRCRHAGGRRHRRRHRGRPARIPQHAGSLVAVRAGRGLRADDLLSADRPDGHSGTHPAAAGAERQRAKREGAA